MLSETSSEGFDDGIEPFGGHGSHVEGNIIAQDADIEGEVKGKVDITELLILKATSVVHGDIATGKLVVEPGAIFNGNCRMGTVKDIKMSDSNSSMRSQQPEARMN